MKTLVKLPNGSWVNPKHVTCIQCRYSGSKPVISETLLWVIKDAGYGTGSFSFAGDQRDALASIINQDPT